MGFGFLIAGVTCVSLPLLLVKSLKNETNRSRVYKVDISGRPREH
jgi:hypothetical protein